MSTEFKVERRGSLQIHLDAYASLYLQNFGTGRKEGSFTGISGRIVRGIVPEHFETLTDNPARKIVFMLDNQGMNNLIGLSGRESLVNIGYPEKDIDGYLSKGYKFKVLVMPETSVHLATWNNLLGLTAEAYPEYRKKIIEAYNHLVMLGYDEIMSVGGAAKEVREFLHKSLNVNELFIGNGTTPNGQKEYVTLNKRIDSFPEYVLIDFPVK
jgi:hypothetical protein